MPINVLPVLTQITFTVGLARGDSTSCLLSMMLMLDLPSL